MKAGRVVLSSLIVYFLVCACNAQKIITVEVGENVTLTCKVPNINNINDITAVEWIKPGLGQDFVFLYRDEQSHPENQHPSYQNRVDLQDKEMKDGNFSLVLKNVTMEDAGRYMCWVFQETKMELISNISLEVLPSGNKVGNITGGGNQDGVNMVGLTVGPVVGVIVLLAAAFGGRLIYKRYIRQNPNHSPPRNDEAEHTPMQHFLGQQQNQPNLSASLMDPAAEEQNEPVSPAALSSR